MSVAGPPQDANHVPSGGNAAAITAGVGAHSDVDPPPGTSGADTADLAASPTPAPARKRPKLFVAPLVPRSVSKGWVRGDATGGLAAATANLALALALGLLAFAPLGPQYAGIGVLAGFASAIYGHVIAGLLGGAAHPGSGPRASTSLILGGLVATLAADPALAPSATRGPELIVALAAAAVVIAGLLQMVLGSLGGGAFARYVPYPFVAGFMCGVSALIIITQVGAARRSHPRRLRRRTGGGTPGSATGDAFRRTRHASNEQDIRVVLEAHSVAAGRACRGQPSLLRRAPGIPRFSPRARRRRRVRAAVAYRSPSAHRRAVVARRAARRRSRDDRRGSSRSSAHSTGSLPPSASTMRPAAAIGPSARS